MADLDFIHTAISHLFPGAGPGDYLWARENDVSGLPAGDPVMVAWDADRFGAFDRDAVLAECHRLATVPPPAPDNPTLSDWRVGLTLWKRLDGNLRIDEVTQKVNDLIVDGNPLGRIAKERLEFANNVLREQLLQLKDTFGFTADEVDESLWRADRVRQGDISGQWPLSQPA